MKEIVVVSGKGGCGKTTVTAALSSIAARDIIIADTDVDAADMHLLMAPEDIRSEAFFSGKRVVVDNEKCIQCGKCVSACHFNALSIYDDHLSVNSFDCEGCGLCTHYCAVDALHMEEQRAGYLHVSMTKTGAPMVHAALDIGADNSGKLVAEVRKKSREIAQQYSKDIILTDGPPGIGCPVIAALSGATMALIVTEPTVSGWHDMSRIHELISKMGAKSALLINKSGLNPDIEKQMHEFASKNDVLDLGVLPYDPLFSKAVSQGLTIPETDNKELISRFQNVWNQLM